MAWKFFEKFGSSPRSENSVEACMGKLSKREQQAINDLWNCLIRQRQNLYGVELSIALVGGIPRSTQRNPSRRSTGKDIDIVIATSAEVDSEVEKNVVVKLEKLVKDYLKGRNINYEQLSGLGWILNQRQSSNTHDESIRILTGSYSKTDIRFITRPSASQHIRPMDIIIAGCGLPNMHQRPLLTSDGRNPYVVLYSTVNYPRN